MVMLFAFNYMKKGTKATGSLKEGNVGAHIIIWLTVAWLVSYEKKKTLQKLGP